MRRDKDAEAPEGLPRDPTESAGESGQDPTSGSAESGDDTAGGASPAGKRRSRRGGRGRSRKKAEAGPEATAESTPAQERAAGAEGVARPSPDVVDAAPEAPVGGEAAPAARPRRRRRKSETVAVPEVTQPEAIAVTTDAAASASGGAAAPEAGETLAAESGVSDEAGTKPSRRRRGGRRKKAADAGGAAEHGESAPGPSLDAEAAQAPPPEAGAAEDAEKKPRRRRGGRRRKPSGAEPEERAGDKVAGDDRVESAPRPADEALKAAEPEAAAAAGTAGVGGEGARVTEGGGEAAEESTAPKRRRGSRGGRRSRARKARLAAAEHEALDRAAAEVAPDHGALLPEAELAEGAPPPLPPAGAPAEPAAEAAATGAVAAEPAGEPATKPARKRGRRGGRKAAAAGAEAEAGLPAEAEAARHPEAESPRLEAAKAGRRAKSAKGEKPVKAEKPAQGEKPTKAEAAEGPKAEGAKTAERPKRRERGRPKAIVRENAELAARPPSDRAAVGVSGAEPVEHKSILVSEQRNEVRVALVEDGHLAEMYFERPGKPSYLGDIYRAKVENVVPGMDAAFIDFGLEKNGFLYVDEVETEEGRCRGRRIADVLRPGQEITVQVMKDPMGSKGARLTTHLSLAGRYLVYVPGGSGVGVSRRLGQGERERLREVSKQLKPRNAGLIVRTYAQGKGLEDLRRDMQYLSRLWSRLKKKAETVKAPGLVYGEADIALEVARDTLNETCERMLVDDEKRFKAIKAYLEKIAPELAGRVELYTGDEPLFEAHGVEEQIARALERRVPLPSGGNLVIDHTEALTVIDVNSGRFTSGRSLEDTILRTNMEAAREVVRQLRLRDIGGIIVIDFIDMAHARNRETVLAKLEAELETDRTKSYVVELSPLGLVEMTRQNTTDGARGILTRTCQTCMGKARVLSEETVALAVERRVRTHARKSNAKAVLVEVNRGVAERLENDGRLKLLERETKRRVFLESSSTVPVEGIRILAEGSVAHVQELRVPVSEGQEVDLELEFALTYSPRDAVGYVEGYMVIVEGGRPYLGEHRRVRIASTARTGATAVLAGGSR